MLCPLQINSGENNNGRQIRIFEPFQFRQVDSTNGIKDCLLDWPRRHRRLVPGCFVAAFGLMSYSVGSGLGSILLAFVGLVFGTLLWRGDDRNLHSYLRNSRAAWRYP